MHAAEILTSKNIIRYFTLSHSSFYDAVPETKLGKQVNEYAFKHIKEQAFIFC